MKKRPICFNYQFHPVGQGLFASGSLYASNTPEPMFNWVYDCGTVSEKALVTNAINSLAAHTWKDKLDMLVISHFDNDHVSGIVELITRFKVGIVLIPYLPLAERLRIMLEQGVQASDPAFALYLNPVTFLLNRSNGNIREIVFVLPAGDSGAIADTEVPRPNDGLNDGRKGSIAGGDGIEFERIAAPKEFSEARVSSLAPRTKMDAMDIWEFVPYNDAEFEPTSATFNVVAQAHADALRDAVSVKDREDALEALKILYETKYSKGRKRNIISLFIFCGPIRDQAKNSSVVIGDRLEAWPYPSRYPCYYRCNAGVPAATSKCSTLYCGDGYLDSPARFDKLEAYMTASRMSRLGVLQVMHHGAEGNWYEGVAGKLNPVFSVFCSDKTRAPHHPHDAVLKDFVGSKIKRVDKISGASFAGWILTN